MGGDTHCKIGFNKSNVPPSSVVAASMLWCCCLFGRYSYITYPNKNNKTIKQNVIRDKSELK